MARSFNNIVVKIVSMALAVSMVLSPMVVYADEIENAENNLSVQTEARDEAADYVVEAEENKENTEVQIESFESVVAELEIPDVEADVNVNDTEIQVPTEDTTVSVEEVISSIENEAIKDAAEAIITVDMSDVDAALDTVTGLVDDVVTDEVVADEIAATADALISVYDAQSEVALNALTVISEEKPEIIAISEDGDVTVDWEKATDEVVALYDAYKGALESKDSAEVAKNKALEEQDAASAKVDELNNGVIKNNKEINETISKSKLDKDTDINKIIDEYVANRNSYKANDEFNISVEGSNDIYKFFVSKCENGIVYGCLTYYDSENKVILRKNFSISADGEVDYEYVPKAEWVKGNQGSDNSFGNGGNYIAAYVADKDKATYISSNKFQGKKVSDLMRANIALNDTIDGRNNALEELNEIKKTVADKEAELVKASDAADAALKEYKRVVEMYKNVASLESEIRNNEVEKAMLEYVKAEVEVYRKQQILDQLNEAINNSNTADTNNEVVEPIVQEKNETAVQEKIDTATQEKTEPATQEKAEPVVQEQNETVAQENIQAVVETIASNLGVEPEVVEAMVVQAIIDTEDNTIAEINNIEEAAVAGARLNVTKIEAATEEIAEETEKSDKAEEVKDKEAVAEKEAVDVQAEIQDETKKTITIEDNEIALANVGSDAATGTTAAVYRIINWWILFIIALACAAWMIFVVAKKNKEDEEAN